MAGPIVFWPNRKSRNGLRRVVSKVPHERGRRFFTEPPVAQQEYEMKFLALGSRNGEQIEFTGGLTAEQAAVWQTFSAALDRWDRETAFLSVEKLVRSFTDHISSLGTCLADAKEQMERVRVELRETSNAIGSLDAEVRRVRDENEAKTADLRKLRKEVDPDEIKLRIMYAVDEATAAKDEELKLARAEIAALKSEVEELKRNKKRLREAIERLSEK